MVSLPTSLTRDSGWWFTFPYHLSIATLSMVTACLQAPPSHLSFTHLGFWLLVQTQDSPSTLIPVSPDNYLPYCNLFTDLLTLLHLQLLGTTPLGVDRLPLALSWSLSQSFSLYPPLFLSATPDLPTLSLPGNRQPSHIPKLQREQWKPRKRTSTQQIRDQIATPKTTSIIPTADA